MNTAGGFADFGAYLASVVDDFLETVVVVDDRAFASAGDVEALDPPGAADVPFRGRGVTSDLVPPAADDALDSKALTDAFAEMGLVCSLLAPGAGESIGARFLNVGRRADLVVLDWDLHGDNGAQTLELLQILLEDDAVAPGRRRLRTVAIHTGQGALESIATRIEAVLSDLYSDFELTRHDDGLTLAKGPVRIAVYAKPDILILPEHLEHRRVAFRDLPRRLRDEFAMLAGGLLGSVALASLGALRDDTHRILSRLGAELDLGYVGHRAALPSPEDAEVHAMDLVESEIESVLLDHDLGRRLDSEVLGLWLSSEVRRETDWGAAVDSSKSLTREQVDQILVVGMGGSDEALDSIRGDYSLKYFKSTLRYKTTWIFSADTELAQASAARFANVMAFRTVYGRPVRTLELGTVICTDNLILLCVQPRCDSVRLKAPIGFPFVPLRKVGPAKGADYVLYDARSGDLMRVRASIQPQDLRVVEFKPSADETVRAITNGDGWVFHDTSSVEYRWLGELKPDFGQQLAVNVAQQFARVATNESEPLRLSRKHD